MHCVDGAPALAQLVGARVRAERQARSWTLDRLAETAGVSRRLLVLLEKGEANPSLGVLLKVASALEVALSALVEQPRPAGVAVTRAGGGAVLWSSPSGGRAVLVASSPSPQVAELWDWTLGAGDRCASAPHPSGTRELLHVLDGQVVVEVADEAVALEPGDALSFRADAPHAYANPGGTPCRFALTVVEPAPGPAPRGGGRRA